MLLNRLFAVDEITDELMYVGSEQEQAKPRC
jgi:hypothetical protein